MKTTLVLETTTPIGSICLIDREGSVEEREFGSDRRHNSALFQPLRELLDGVDELELVLVGSGPGSYSGTRVGIAAAQGVAIAMNCPAVAVPSALAIEPVSKGVDCLMVGDARRGTFWSAKLAQGAMSEPCLQDLESWKRTLREVCADGWELVSFEDPGRWDLPDGFEIRVVVPKARLLWQAWQRADSGLRSVWQGQVPQPMYLKPPHITQAKPKSWERPS